MKQLLINGNSLNELKNIESNSITSIVTDPPYEIGYMGKSWDRTGIAYSIELWRECFRVLKPGGFLLSFSATRTYHRMACAIEDAGFEIRDMIEWIYGSGFPKNLDLGKHDEKLKGFGTSLKPAHEPICMARKPLSENTVLENFLKHGTGVLNIDKSRVKIEKLDFEKMSNRSGKRTEGQLYKSKGDGENWNPNKSGRFPANLIHDGSDCVLNEFPVVEGKDNYKHSASSIFGSKTSENTYNGNSRSTWENATRFFYCAKPSKKEKGHFNTHVTVKPIKLMEYLIQLVTIGGIVLDPFMGSGTTGIACLNLGFKFVGIELEKESFEIAGKRIHEAQTLFSSVCP